MNWIEIAEETQLDSIREKSKEVPQVIFKHSTRCSVSSMVKTRLEKAQQPSGADFYFLDLIKHRSISNRIAADFEVYHESPQVLVIRNGACVYDESHMGIQMRDIEAQVKTA